MNERQKRLNEVYDHLRKHYGIHSQQDFADAIRYSRSVVSSSLNGNEDNLTDKFFKNICSTYKGTFELEYLLNGTGELLTVEEQVKIGEIEQIYSSKTPQVPDYMQRVFDEAVKLSTRAELLGEQLSLALADNRELKENLRIALASVEGMKQQMTMLLQYFNGYTGQVSQFRENFVSETIK